MEPNDKYQSHKLTRLTEIDILRAVAILLVLGRHILIIPKQESYLLTRVVQFWRNCGWIGVDLFFVISGFLISGLLFREYLLTKTIDPTRFLIRRALKLYPAFYFFLFIGTATIFPMTQWVLSWKGALGEVLYLQNYLGSLWNHTWSLAVEEHFYLAFVFLLAFLLPKAKKNGPFDSIPRLFLIVATACLCARVYLGYALAKPWPVILIPTHLRIDSLLFGVVLSFYYHFHFESLQRFHRKYSWLILFCSVIAIAPSVLFIFERTRFVYTVGLSLLYLGFGGLLLNFLFSESSTKKVFLTRLPFLSSIGRHSYSIYLWHMAAFVLSYTVVSKFGGKMFALEKLLGVYLVVSLLIGIGMSKLVEQPVLRIRNRIFPSRCGNLSDGK